MSGRKRARLESADAAVAHVELHVGQVVVVGRDGRDGAGGPAGARSGLVDPQVSRKQLQLTVSPASRRLCVERVGTCRTRVTPRGAPSYFLAKLARQALGVGDVLELCVPVAARGAGAQARPRSG